MSDIAIFLLKGELQLTNWQCGKWWLNMESISVRLLYKADK